jgi:hypothetical protein
MHIVGIVEILVGLAVLLGLTRLGGLVVVAWLALISIKPAAGWLFRCCSPRLGNGSWSFYAINGRC